MGKKYIIEIEELPFEKPEVYIGEDRNIPREENEQLFRAAGFDSLVFTKEELNRLTPLPEDYERWLRERDSSD